MSSFNRTNQGGAILTFIIVGVVLALAAAGLIYGVQQRGEQARRDAAIATADQQNDTEQPPEAESAPESEPSQEEAPAEPAPAPAAPPTPSVTPQPDQLPTTGPESDATILFAVAMMTTSVTAYVMSRRALNRSL